LEEEPDACSSEGDYTNGAKLASCKQARLPPGWTRLIDPSTGKIFFNHPALGSQWEHPSVRSRSPTPDSDDDFVPGGGQRSFDSLFLASPRAEDDMVQLSESAKDSTPRRPLQGLGVLGSRLLDAKVAAQEKAAAQEEFHLGDDVSVASGTTLSVKTLPASSVGTSSDLTSTLQEDTMDTAGMPPRSEQRVVGFQSAQKPFWARDEVVAPSMMALPVAGFLLTSMI